MTLSTLDPAAILAALGIGNARAAEPVTGGWDTMIWRVEHDGMVSALRLFRATQAHTMRREIAAMRAAAAHVPVPEVRAAGTWEDRPALLLAWCPGRPLAHCLLEQPAQAGPLGIHFGRMQARIHAAPVAAELDVEPHAWMSWAGSDETALQERLRREAPAPPSLLHLDYHPLNVLSDGERVTAVLDWANARIGDRRADLARTVSILRLAPAPPDLPRTRVRGALRELLRGWWQGYTAAAGPVDGMAPFYAWAGAVMARDLAPKLGQPGIWLEQRDFDRLDRWTIYWKRRAGVPS